MLVNFRIKNFGTIREVQTLSFIADKKNSHLDQHYTIEVAGLRLLKLIFLYGANASGKTTILQALDFLHTLTLKPNSIKNDYIVFEPYLLDNYSRNEDSELEVDFIHNGLCFIYTVAFNKRYIVKETLKSFQNSKRGKIIA